jgi:hypothetical protein
MDDEPIDTITSSVFDRDKTNETLGSATIDTTEFMDECYIRGYIVLKQDGVEYKFALGTVLVQTPSDDYDGKVHNYSLDAYTPLVELKKNNPPIGFSIMKNQPIMDTAATLCSENMRAPVIEADNSDKLTYDYVAELNDNWLTYLSSLISNAKFGFALDTMGRIFFEPAQEIEKLQPVWIYTDDNSSILLPDIKIKRDFYDIPNAVEVVYSSNSGCLRGYVVNDDPNSPVSTVNRGRIILHRETNPSVQGNPTDEYIQEYAKQLLKNLSCMEYTVSYSHAYCPVGIGDCILFDSEKAGLDNVKAQVISQSIKCKTGCVVEETAVFTKQLWG